MRLQISGRGMARSLVQVISRMESDETKKRCDNEDGDFANRGKQTCWFDRDLIGDVARKAEQEELGVAQGKEQGAEDSGFAILLG